MGWATSGSAGDDSVGRGADGPRPLAPLPVDLPAGWHVVETGGPAGFPTRATLVRPDGSRVVWTSRRHRKGLGLLDEAAPRRGRADPWSWWIGGLFAVGALCFALASLPVLADAVSAGVVAWTFATGSVFFTGAAYLQLHEALRAPDGVLGPTGRSGTLRRLLARGPSRIDLWATAVQLVGTLLFNVSTFAATRADVTLAHDRHFVWAPDVLGSVCFLVASWLAYVEVDHGVLPKPDRSVGWWVAAVNLLGSLAFGVSAVAARYLPSGATAHGTLDAVGTFVGAVCFLVGAMLLPVESARDAVASPGPTPRDG